MTKCEEKYFGVSVVAGTDIKFNLSFEEMLNVPEILEHSEDVPEKGQNSIPKTLETLKQ